MIVQYWVAMQRLQLKYRSAEYAIYSLDWGECARPKQVMNGPILLVEPYIV
jgi:hypothetical protein